MTDGLVFAIVGLNILIGFGIYSDIKEKVEEERIKTNRMKNLLSETIDIQVTEEEWEILEDLSKGNITKHLREQIKELCNNK